MNFFVLIEKHFVAVFLLALISGFLFPFVGVLAFITPLMFALAIFLASLKVDFSLFVKHLKDLDYFVRKFFVIKIFVPLIAFFVLSIFVPELALAGLLVLALPSGMTNIVFSDLFKGNNALTLLFTVITHLVSPITIPLLVFLVSFKSVGFDYFGMFLSLAGIVLLPVLLAYLVKSKLREKIKGIEVHLSGINLLIVAGIVFIIIAENAEKFSDLTAFINPIIFVFFLFLFMTFLGLVLTRKEPKENQIAVSLSSFHVNGILGLLIASTYFSVQVVAVLIATQLIIDLFIAFYKILIDRILK